MDKDNDWATFDDQMWKAVYEDHRAWQPACHDYSIGFASNPQPVGGGFLLVSHGNGERIVLVLTLLTCFFVAKI